jgi:hypothetical protein
MLDKKLGVFSAFLLLGIATLFLPSTVLQNSIAMGQEFIQNMKKINIITKNMIRMKIMIKMFQ